MEQFLCGVDLGGTKLSVGLVKPDGTLVDEMRTHDHVKKDESGIIKDIADIINTLLAKNGLAESSLMGIGVVFPGHIRSFDGVSITTSNLSASFKNYPFRQSIQHYFKNTNVYVDNDANAQAYAEYKYGAGKGYDNMIFVTVSTGIGSGIIVDGKLMRGMSGTAGEVGHTIIRPESHRKCTCGNYGCLMTQACGIFLKDIAIDHLKAGIISNKIGITLDNVNEQVNGFSIKLGLDFGDELAKAVVFESADAVGIALYNLFQLFNPQVIVLGGGLINWGDAYTDRIKQKFYSLAKDMLFDDMKIVTTEIGKNAGVLGASSLPLEHL